MVRKLKLVRTRAVSSLFLPLQRSDLFQSVIREMGSEGPPVILQSPPHRRPFCPHCFKPARLCLCVRLASPPLDNSVAVTILQHSLEKGHPLNSTRVAKLGLKNLAVVPVTDVNFQAQFSIRPLVGISSDLAASGSGICNECDRNYGQSKELPFLSERIVDVIPQPDTLDDDSVFSTVCKNNGSSALQEDLRKKERLFFYDEGEGSADTEDLITISSEKCAVTCSSSDIKIAIERNVKPKIGPVSTTPVGRATTSNGFVVKKLQRRQVRPTKEFEDFEEFAIVIPPGTALLYPTDKAISLKDVDFEVKHLIVLDGTWAKSKRMYHENPWLQLLQHLKLDAGNESLYSGVRRQPRSGCLSTIESLVCTLKALGEEEEGLDRLLGVFNSMIEDQKQCKAEKFRLKAEMSLKK